MMPTSERDDARQTRNDRLQGTSKQVGMHASVEAGRCRISDERGRITTSFSGDSRSYTIFFR
eukprot:9484416-Pyramimonas_sp.AAC.1